MLKRPFNWASCTLCQKAALVGLPVFVAALFGGWGYVSQRLPAPGHIHAAVLVEGESLGGMTMEAARVTLERLAQGVLDRKVRLTLSGHQWTFTCRELGARPQIEQTLDKAYRIGRFDSRWDDLKFALSPPQGTWQLRLRYDFDRELLRKKLTALKDAVEIPAIDAYAELQGEVVRVEPGQWGESLDLERSLDRVVETLADPAEVTEVRLVLSSHKPKVTYEDLKHLDCVLAEYQTRFNPAKVNRSHNLRLAGAAIDKTLLKPNETFSYNDIVGPRVEEKGYRPAAIFADGEVVEEIGGGICQVASTCYNAAVLAGLKIVQRRPHSRPVDYCPAGRDATVYFGQIDLKFRNNTDQPIYLRTSVIGSRVRVMVLGSHNQQVDVELVPGMRELTPFKEERQEDDSLAPGEEKEEQEGRQGLKLQYRRVIKRKGKLIADELLSRDVYKPQNRIVRVGPAVPTPTGSETTPPKPPGFGETPTSPRPTPRIEDDPLP